MALIPLTVHDTAYAQTPAPFAVSRITLRIWCSNYHPETVRGLHRVPALADVMSDALTRLRMEAPDFIHGALIHGVQKTEGGPIEPPVVGTIVQYARRFTVFNALPLAVTARHFPQPPQHVIIHDRAGDRELPKWAWYMLGASLLHDVEIVGEPPAPLT